MANQTAATKAKGLSSSVSSPIPTHGENRHLLDRMNSEIARRAYQLFQDGGSAGGQDLVHWLQAESEIVRKIPEIRESSSWYTVDVPLKGFTADEVYVGVERTRATIVADKRGSANESGTAQPASYRESVFLAAKWPAEVDPATASAYIKDESLTLTVKRSTPSAK